MTSGTYKMEKKLDVAVAVFEAIVYILKGAKKLRMLKKTGASSVRPSNT